MSTILNLSLIVFPLPNKAKAEQNINTALNIASGIGVGAVLFGPPI